MYDQSLEQLIDAVIADGVITDQERIVVYKKAASLGIDQDEIEVYLEGRLAKVAQNKPKSNKEGNVKKCPACGAFLQGGNAICPECGYTLSNVKVNSSSELLDKRLREASDKKERANIIRSFPIPNTREDLLEFLSMLEPKALQGEDTEETKACYEKFIECINKARISFGNDPATKIFEEKLAQYKKKSSYKKGLIALVILLLVGFFGYAVYEDYAKKHQKQNRAIELENDYNAWCETIQPQLEAYCDSLCRELDNIPTPTTSNWQECGKMWNSITWSKSWIPVKFRSEVGIFNNIERDYGERFIEKKNNIGKSIRDAHMQELINKGAKSSGAENRTRNEFYEIKMW